MTDMAPEPEKIEIDITIHESADHAELTSGIVAMPSPAPAVTPQPVEVFQSSDHDELASAPSVSTLPIAAPTVAVDSQGQSLADPAPAVVETKQVVAEAAPQAQPATVPVQTA